MAEVLNCSQNGYHGGIVDCLPAIKVQSCSNTLKDMKFDLYNQASLRNDPSTARLEVQQSIGPGAYHLDNMNECECELKKAREIQLSQPAINFSGGKGWIGEQGCLVNNDSDLRFDELTNLKYIHQLPNLLNQGFYGRGPHDVDVETIIQNSNITNTGEKPCNVLAGVTIPNFFTPLIPKLEKEVQDTDHIIPEDSMSSWVRGGLPSRQIARNLDYIQRCDNLRNKK